MKLWPVLLILPLAACMSRGPMPKEISDSRCMALADSLKTLKVGDPLPRVKEVLGHPQRSYRALTTFGKRYDVMEYDTGTSPCALYLLDSPSRLVVMFDPKGRLISYGKTQFVALEGATSVRLRRGIAGGY